MQYVDDAFTSPDGRVLYVSRPSLADVIALDLGTRQIAWRVKVDGYRSDHMAPPPDGTRLLVSASTAGKVQVIDTARGAIVGEFASGDQPPENNFSRDGTRIFHASIGSVYTPLDLPELDTTKGRRFFQVVDARTYEILQRTSFNGRGEPIVSSVADAAGAFRRLGLDFLVLDDELIAHEPGWWRAA